MSRRLPEFTLFPYTTLFRSLHRPGARARARSEAVRSATGGISGPHGHALVRRRRRRCGSTVGVLVPARAGDRKSTRLNSSHPSISYAVFCLKKKKLLSLLSK